MKLKEFCIMICDSMLFLYNQPKEYYPCMQPLNAETIIITIIIAAIITISPTLVVLHVIR